MGKYGIQVDSLVSNNYQGLVRYGTVTKKTVRSDGWAYYQVAWHRDQDYEEAIEWRNSLNNQDNGVQEYRGDQLLLVNNPAKIVGCVDDHLDRLATTDAD